MFILGENILVQQSINSFAVAVIRFSEKSIIFSLSFGKIIFAKEEYTI